MISWITMIPTHYNDGRKIPLDVTTALLWLVGRTFEGYTFDGPSEGCYQGQREPVRRLTVACDESRLPEARAFAKRMGQHLGQKAMYFATNRDTVEILTL